MIPFEEILIAFSMLSRNIFSAMFLLRKLVKNKYAVFPSNLTVIGLIQRLNAVLLLAFSKISRAFFHVSLLSLIYNLQF